MNYRRMLAPILLLLCISGCIVLPLLVHTPYPESSKDLAELVTNWELAIPSREWPSESSSSQRPTKPGNWRPLAEQAIWMKQNHYTGEYWLRKKMPDHTWRDPHLFVTGQKYFELYMNAEKIYSYNINQQNKRVNEQFHWSLIPLKPDLGGKTLYVRGYKDRMNPIIGTYIIGNATDLNAMMIKQDSVKLILSVLFFVFGIGSLCLYVASREEKVYLYFCAFSLLLVCGSVSRTHLAQWLGDIPFTAYLQDLFMPFGLIALFFLMQAISSTRRTKTETTQKFAISIILIFSLLCLAVAWADPNLYRSLYVYGFPYVFVVAFIVSFWNLRRIQKRSTSRKRREIRILSFGYSVIALLILFHLINEFVTPLSGAFRKMFPLLSQYWQDDQIFMSAFIFDMCLCAVLLMRFMETHRRARESAATLALKNEKLQAMDLLKDEFLAKTSHELRMPLGGIIGITEAMLDGAAGPINPGISDRLSLIIHSGQRLSSIINDILDYSKLKHRDVQLHIKKAGIQQIADVVLGVLKPKADQKNIAIINDIPDALPYIAADEDRLRQVLSNLIGNAIKFTQEGHVRITTEVANGFLAVSVSDTGIGIAEEYLESIFLSFDQGPPTISNRYGGTGLGLTISKQFIELHGGTIQVLSTLGVGSIFIFTIPLWQGEPDISIEGQIDSSAPVMNLPDDQAHLRSVPLEPRPMNPQKPIILVVDDEPINLEVAAAYLGKENLVIKAKDAFTALLWIKEYGKPDLVLSDVMMPDMTGYELCSYLRHTYNTAELPILLLTAKDQTKDMAHGFDAGANDYLKKPVAKQELLARVHLHLELSRLNHSLEEQVRLRTAELEQTYRQLQSSMNETLEALGEVAIWEERNRIAQDIHDILGHKLTGTIVQIEAAKRLMSKNPETALQKLELAQETVRKGLDDIRVAVRMMKDDIGKELSSSLIELIEETAEMTGVTIEYDIGELPDLDAMQKKVIYHALQEGLTNGIKHGKSSLFFFKLEYESDWVSFLLMDDGVPYTESPLGFGLTAMKEKVQHLGGTIRIGSASSGGCELGIMMPAR
ncbi:ATP-binding protein [Paenibacillus sedimenti]|uniref:Circadian input-output histidine kinase CikA n=1 Tax=Paenibacillus sedimenti TaxID=2770274 RepID=A0A926QL96_9BACL|nr:ATP-binding protein [Paenibacillus sedimenti]MBD0382618.1 response regulator [Paenibacillus sedimenti]